MILSFGVISTCGDVQQLDTQARSQAEMSEPTRKPDIKFP